MSLDARLVVVSRLFYEQQLSKTEIAEKLNLSITHVNRLLREAANQGVVRISIEPPILEDLADKLKRKYDLADTCVALAPGDEDEQELRVELGMAGARYLEKTTRDGDKVGLGSGRTLFEMVGAVSEESRSITVYPLSACADQDLDVKSIDANTLVKILWFKSRPKSSARRFELFFPDEPKNKIKSKVQNLLKQETVVKFTREVAELDAYYFSCSSRRQDSQLVNLAAVYGSHAESSSHSLIGDIVFNNIDALGQYQSTDIDQLLFKVPLDTLRRAASDGNRRVVLIAGGKTKYSVIRAALKARVFNTLITDRDSAERLLSEAI